MKKYSMGSLVVWLVFVIGGLALTFGYGWRPHLGLDLQGGLSATLVPKEGTDPPESSVSEAASIIRQRVDALGIAEPEVVRSGKTVVVQLPGLKTKADQERAREMIGTTAKLQFHQVVADLGADTSALDPGDGSGDSGTPTTVAPSTSTPPTSTAPPTTAEGDDTRPTSKAPTAPGVEPIGYQTPSATTVPDTGDDADADAATDVTTPGDQADDAPAEATDAVPDDQPVDPDEAIEQFKAANPGSDVYVGEGQRYLLGPTLFDGTVLSSADAQLGPNSQWEVNVKVKGDEKSRVNDAFNECYSGAETCPAIRAGDDGGNRGAIAIVLDGEVISAPTVNAIDLPLNADGFVITGNFTKKSADGLALQLRYGALPVEFQQATLETVSATLGSNSVRAAVVSGVVGLILVSIYMLAFYRLLGIIAILSLATSTGALWIVISYLGTHSGLALTLAGLTGIIISVGIAVDSNVVFYEHLREDMTKGRSLRETVRPSFKKAWGTIVSADTVSIMGAIILYVFTVGPVRGFAFYLGLSTFVDLVASWFFMRPLSYWLATRKVFNRRPGLLGVEPHDVDPDAIVAAKAKGVPA